MGRVLTDPFIGVLLPKLATPFTNRFIGHNHAPFQEQFLDIAEAQTKPKVQPHGVADDLDGKAVVLVTCGRRYGAHAATVSQKRSAKQVVNAF